MFENLTAKQRELLEELAEAWPGWLEVSGPEITVARSLDRRGLVNVARDQYGSTQAQFDDEPYADWARARAAEEEAAC